MDSYLAFHEIPLLIIYIISVEKIVKGILNDIHSAVIIANGKRIALGPTETRSVYRIPTNITQGRLFLPVAGKEEGN